MVPPESSALGFYDIVFEAQGLSKLQRVTRLRVITSRQSIFYSANLQNHVEKRKLKHKNFENIQFLSFLSRVAGEAGEVVIVGATGDDVAAAAVGMGLFTQRLGVDK